MGAWQSSFYGLTLVGARMDRLGESETHITSVDGIIENIYSTLLYLSFMLESR